MARHQIQKLYYSIGEVSELLEIEPHVLRYWQTEFPQLAPRKNRAGRRIYTQEDIDVIERIQYLLRVEKYTIEGARQQMEEGDDPSEEERFRMELVKLRGLLEDVLHQLS